MTIIKSFCFATTIIALFLSGCWTKSSAGADNDYNLVVVKNGSPAQMFEAGLKVLGGMQRFVKKGQVVLVKPNIGFEKTPEQGANTNPDLVQKIIESAYAAGAAKVYVFDHPNISTDSIKCYQLSGIERVAHKTGATLEISREELYQEVIIPKAKTLTTVKVYKKYLEADVVINVPVLKHHASTKMTAALKNLMGVVWDRKSWHRIGLHESIAEFSLLRKPELTIIDAYRVIYRNGPRGITADDIWFNKMLLLSTDPVLADTAAAKILGINPHEVKYLQEAAKLGIGSMDLGKNRIQRIRLL